LQTVFDESQDCSGIVTSDLASMTKLTGITQSHPRRSSQKDYTQRRDMGRGNARPNEAKTHPKILNLREFTELRVKCVFIYKFKHTISFHTAGGTCNALHRELTQPIKESLQ